MSRKKEDAVVIFVHTHFIRLCLLKSAILLDQQVMVIIESDVLSWALLLTSCSVFCRLSDEVRMQMPCCHSFVMLTGHYCSLLMGNRMLGHYPTTMCFFLWVAFVRHRHLFPCNFELLVTMHECRVLLNVHIVLHSCVKQVEFDSFPTNDEVLSCSSYTQSHPSGQYRETQLPPGVLVILLSLWATQKMKLLLLSQIWQHRFDDVLVGVLCVIDERQPTGYGL